MKIQIFSIVFLPSVVAVSMEAFFVLRWSDS